MARIFYRVQCTKQDGATEKKTYFHDSTSTAWQSDDWKQQNHWLKETWRWSKRLKVRRERWTRRWDRKRGEQRVWRMANCTRVSQPGSESVLCIRTGLEKKGRGTERAMGWWVREEGGHSGLEGMPLGHCSTWVSHHILPMLDLCRTTLPG